MGVANELIAVGWGYSGFANQPEFLFLSHLFHCYYYHTGGEGVTSYLRHSWMNLISNSDCQKVFGNVDNALNLIPLFPIMFYSHQITFSINRIIICAIILITLLFIQFRIEKESSLGIYNNPQIF